MKILKLSFFFILLSLQLFSTNPEKIVTHQIDAITLFLNSAEISRSAEVQIPVGKTDLIFKGISKRMMDQGIKLFISNQVKVFAINKEYNKLVLEDSDVFQELEKEKTALYQEIQAVRIQRIILEKELAYFESNMKLHNNSTVNFAEVDEGANYFRKKLSEIHKLINVVDTKLFALDKRKEKFLENYQEQKIKIAKASNIIRVTVESKSAVNAKIDLKYLVTNALWKPYYSVRANDEKETVLIEYQAQLYNDTGIDWDNKPISLAILNSSDDVTKPELETWSLEESNLDRKSKNKRRKFSSTAQGTLDKRDKREEVDFLQIDDLSTRFEIADLHLIPADATPHLIDVISYDKKVEFYNLSIPKVKNGAFLIARIKDWESLGLIDGDINLYYNDTYQGISKLKTNEVSDTLDLSMGKENNFIVSRKKVSTSSRKNLIGFNIKEVLTYEIQVKNNKAESGIIELKDQIPISISKDVEVKALDLSRGKLDPLTGQVTWSVSLDPGETKKLTLRFSIKYPKSKKNSIFYKSKIITTPRYF